jgi:hypothetical protein
MDNLIFEESLATEVDQSEFISKKYIYVNDSNSQNYTSQIVLDSTPLSNAGGYVNWSEGFIVIPMVVQLTSAVNTNLPLGTELADYTWAFKNGFWNMINSMTVDFNNQNIVQQTPFTNVFRTFKALTSWSEEDVKNHGADTGFYVDNAGSWSYHYNSTGITNANIAGNVGVNTAGSNGWNVGISNNRDAPLITSSGLVSGTVTIPPVVAGNVTEINSTITNLNTIFNNGQLQASSGVLNGNKSYYASNKYSFNDGFLCRQSVIGYDPTNNSSRGQELVNDTTTCNTVYRSQKRQDQAGNIYWNVLMKLRLKDLTDYFEKTPLLKGSTMRFLINTNQSLVEFAKYAPTTDPVTGVATSSGTIKILRSEVTGGASQPLMIASADFQQGCARLPAGNYLLTSSIVANTNSVQASYGAGVTYQLGSHPLKSTRLYAPVYTFNPIAESRYLSLAPTKKITYRDIFQYQFSGINAGDNFNFLVTNGINSIRSVLCVPYVSRSQNPQGLPAYDLDVSAVLNPCAPSPAIPDPITLTNFNILVSGVNLFLNNELYDFEAFTQQLAQSNQLNGGTTTGLASGLISADMFSRGYRYYYGDCSRVLPSEAGVSRSVQIIGQNASKIKCDIMVFVEFERSMVIDISTGARIE